MSPVGTLALVIVFGAHLIGGFSRLTHGRYTPTFYAYQLDRAPNNASTWIIPYIDILLCLLLVNPGTRLLGASLSTIMQCVGIVKRVIEKKNVAVDVGLLCCAVVASMSAS